MSESMIGCTGCTAVFPANRIRCPVCRRLARDIRADLEQHKPEVSGIKWHLVLPLAVLPWIALLALIKALSG